jgi:uncharacterized protein YaiE (UPF0345 family)
MKRPVFMDTFALLIWNYSTYNFRTTDWDILVCVSTSLNVEQQNNRGWNFGTDKKFFCELRSSWILRIEWW